MTLGALCCLLAVRLILNYIPYYHFAVVMRHCQRKVATDMCVRGRGTGTCRKPCLFTAGNNCCCTLPVATASCRKSPLLSDKPRSAHTSHVARLHLLCKLLIFFNNRQSNGRHEGVGREVTAAELRPRNMLDGCAPK